MSKKTKALLGAIIGNSIFGFSFLFSKIAIDMTIPSVMLAARFTTAFVVLNLIVLFGKLIKKKNGEALVAFSLKGKPLKHIALLALVQPVIYFIGEGYGIANTSSSFSGTLISVVPVVGIVLDVFIMKTRVTAKQIVCAVASIIGVAITTLGASDMKSTFFGTLMLLVAVVASALFYVFSKKAAAHYNPLERTYVMFAVGSVVYIILGITQGSRDFAKLIVTPLSNMTFWGCIFYLGVFSSVIAFIVLNYASGHISVSQASIFANLTTVISIVAGVVVLQEKFTFPQVIGAVIIIGSVYLSSVSRESYEKS